MLPITTASGLAPRETNANEAIGIVRPAITTSLGTRLFAIPMVVFGIQHFMYAGFVNTLMPAWIPGRPFWTYFTGIALIAAGTAITLGRLARLAATLLGIMVFIFFLLVHIPQVVATPGNPDQWTYLSQAFTFSGIALVVAGVTRTPSPWPSDLVAMRCLALGRWMIAAGLLVLGTRQLFGFPFVHRLVPAWEPGQHFWAVLSAVLLIATGAGIIVKRERLPAILLGVVLMLFLAVFHLPRLAVDPRNNDWGSACKNSIVCGGALVLAGARRTSKAP